MPQPRTKRRTQPPKRSRSFNADERAAKRGEEVITIGGQEFHRRLKNHGVTREARDISVAQDRCNARIERAEKEIAESEDLTLEQVEEREDEMLDWSDEAIEKSYELVTLLLVDGEGKPPAMTLLKEKLDTEELSALCTQLLGGGEPAEGPTQTRSS